MGQLTSFYFTSDEIAAALTPEHLTSVDVYVQHLFETVFRDTPFTERELKTFHTEVVNYSWENPVPFSEKDVMDVFRMLKKDGTIHLMDSAATPNIWVNLDEVYKLRQEKERDRKRVASRSLVWEQWLLDVVDTALTLSWARYRQAPGF